MSNTKFEHLFKKYLAHTCTESERMELMAMIDQEANEEQLAMLMEKVWDDQNDQIAPDRQKARELFSRVISHSGQPAQPVVKKLSWIKWAAAAAVLVGFALAAVFYSNSNKTVREALVQAKTTDEHQLIKLADGSTVVLNKSSYLSYPAKFDGKSREVSLIGEGYFDIRHNAQQPFIVHTGKIATTVLGTAFNIKAYNQEKDITVTVTRGKVSVSNGQRVLGIITPDQQIAFNKTEQNTVQSTVNSDKVVEWQSKDLFLSDVTMQQAAQALEQRFNVKITFGNEEVKKCRFTGTFLHGEKLSDILQVICDFNNATSKTADNEHYVINGPGCP